MDNVIVEGSEFCLTPATLGGECAGCALGGAGDLTSDCDDNPCDWDMVYKKVAKESTDTVNNECLYPDTMEQHYVNILHFLTGYLCTNEQFQHGMCLGLIKELEETKDIRVKDQLVEKLKEHLPKEDS